MHDHLEGEACAGKILFLTSDLIKQNPDLIKLKTAINMVPEEIRKIRKILGTTQNKYYLVADGYKIYGLLSEAKANISDEIYGVKFIKQFYWQIGKFCRSEFISILDIKYFDVKFHKPPINKQELKEKIDHIFKEKRDSSKLIKIITKMINQRHGTMIVILEEDCARSESERLNSQNFSIEPIELEVDHCVDLTNMDGAILLDSDGKCYALGVILDGVESKKCDISRGARYNSAIRYLEKMEKHKILIIVISEDGMIDKFTTEDN